MSRLSVDILYLIFKEFQDDQRPFSFVMISSLWCTAAIPILWNNFLRDDISNYGNKSYLFVIFAYYLPGHIKESLKKGE